MGRTVVNGNFEWDEEKAVVNLRKHGISFEEILPVFDDPLFWEKVDVEHSSVGETRFFGIGKINGFAVVVSSYTERERIRIISARISTKKEEREYEKWCKQFYN